MTILSKKARNEAEVKHPLPEVVFKLVSDNIWQKYLRSSLNLELRELYSSVFFNGDILIIAYKKSKYTQFLPHYLPLLCQKGKKIVIILGFVLE